MRKPAEALDIDVEQRRALESILRLRTAEQRVVMRARIVLSAAAGRANQGIARELKVSRPTVLQWRARFVQGGVEALLHDAPRPGRPRVIDARKVEGVVEATLHRNPPAATHWSVRSMAAVQGLSPATVQRIWSAHGLQPHRVETFKLSRDKRFVEKLRDVVGLYLNPPEHALVLSIDEKSQIQALDRTQPGLPLKKGRAGTMTHDYKRNGTTTLFAALNILDGKVIGQCLQRHRHQEFLRFMRKVDRDTPAELDVHCIIDNYSTHKHPAVQRWLKRHSRFHMHFVPTSSSWLNLVERWFREITSKRIRRGSFPSVAALVKAIEEYLEHNNENPKPFVWTASVEQILEKVSSCKAILETLH
ncbi:MAG: IS630 family transposase [Candidatus Rokubacteria bacterium]|nr:IS630 family transposase [Candidatus Rokubacteria bacterium]